jgi:hypothetical protein
MAQQTGNANSSSSSGATAGSTATSNSNVGTSRATGGQASANPTATASAGSASATSGTVTLNVYGTDPNSSGTGAASGTSGTSGVSNTSTDNVNYSGTTTVRNTPDVGAPAIYGGTNPCSVGASAGLGIPGFGLSGGATWSDHGCERRNTAVILYQANKAMVAEALLCQDKDTRAAFMAAGDPCPQDRTPVARAAAPEQVVAAATPALPPPPAQDQVASRKVSGGYVGPKPAWCTSPVKDSTDQAFHSFYCGA